MSRNDEDSMKVRCFSIFKSFFGSHSNQNEPKIDLKHDSEEPAFATPAIATPAALQIPDVGSAYIYPPHQSISVIPAAPPPSIKVEDVIMLEEDQYASKNILLTKKIPDHFSKKCQAEFGPEVFSLVEQIHSRRRILDCEKVPSDCGVSTWEESWCTSTPSRDVRGEQLVNALIGQLRRGKKKFVDPHFPPADISLFADPGQTLGSNAAVQQTFRKDQDPFLAGLTGIEWKRPEEMGQPNQRPVVFSGDISPDDVAQGRLGNCYYLAAISSCADGDDDMLVKDLIVEQGMDVGVFGVKFFVDGRWTTVIIDDLFPCVKSHNGTWKPIFASPKDHVGQAQGERELWALIFEKAWAKLHLSYEATAAGFTDDAHNYLTGGVNSTVALGVKPEEEWHQLRELTAEDNFAFLSTHTRAGIPDGELRKKGLISGHAYSILGTFETLDSAIRLVQVRNPWGSDEWKGAYSDKAPEWTPELRLNAKAVDAEDGSFWMCFADFFKYYGDVAVCDPRVLCRMYSDGMARLRGASAHWIAGKTAGGLSTAATFKYNPQFELCAEGSEVYIAAYQPDVRALELVREGLEFVSMSVYLIDPDAGPASSAKPALALNFARQKACRVEVVPGKTYRLVAAAWGPGVQGAFTLTACGNSCSLKALPLEIPSSNDADKMALRPSRLAVCIISGERIKGSYYATPDGPVLVRYYEQYRARQQ